jgi:hypothetical protein
LLSRKLLSDVGSLEVKKLVSASETRYMTRCRKRSSCLSKILLNMHDARVRTAIPATKTSYAQVKTLKEEVHAYADACAIQVWTRRIQHIQDTSGHQVLPYPKYSLTMNRVRYCGTLTKHQERIWHRIRCHGIPLRKYLYRLRLVHDPYCELCEDAMEETVEHVLMHCVHSLQEPLSSVPRYARKDFSKVMAHLHGDDIKQVCDFICNRVRTA